jgi:hypothetical protein
MVACVDAFAIAATERTNKPHTRMNSISRGVSDGASR